MKSRIINLKKTTATYSKGTLTPNGVDVLEEISAEEGMYLTQSYDVDIMDRVIGKSVMLGKGCSSNEWKEITKEEADAIIEEYELTAKKLIEEQDKKLAEELENEISYE